MMQIRGVCCGSREVAGDGVAGGGGHSSSGIFYPVPVDLWQSATAGSLAHPTDASCTPFGGCRPQPPLPDPADAGFSYGYGNNGFCLNQR